jgi:hypothetical protein
MSEIDAFANNRALRELIESSGLTLSEVLARFNARQARPIALRTLNSYLANEGAKTRVRCPEPVIVHMRTVMARIDKRNVRNSAISDQEGISPIQRK